MTGSFVDSGNVVFRSSQARARLSLKQSLQRTGLPCVGRKGTGRLAAALRADSRRLDTARRRAAVTRTALALGLAALAALRLVLKVLVVVELLFTRTTIFSWCGR